MIDHGGLDEVQWLTGPTFKYKRALRHQIKSYSNQLSTSTSTTQPTLQIIIFIPTSIMQTKAVLSFFALVAAVAGAAVPQDDLAKKDSGASVQACPPEFSVCGVRD